MAKVISLGKARKAKAKAERLTQAEANRRKHGRTGAEKKAARLEAERAREKLDGHKREAPPPSEDTKPPGENARP